VITAQYLTQANQWPTTGRHILARHDAESIYVYQAYNSAIAAYAIQQQRFGGPAFSYSRMSWIKPNFLWMMYRCGWASKAGQEHVLAIRLRRSFFDELLCNAVYSTFDATLYSTHDAWKRALAGSEVRLQWDPDHDPHGHPLQRRAIQLGLRGTTLQRYGTTENLSIEDITAFVKEQAQLLTQGLEQLSIPAESAYQPNLAASQSIGLDTLV
jgi:hypothetical protein